MGPAVKRTAVSAWPAAGGPVNATGGRARVVTGAGPAGTAVVVVPATVVVVPATVVVLRPVVVVGVVPVVVVVLAGGTVVVVASTVNLADALGEAGCRAVVDAVAVTVWEPGAADPGTATLAVATQVAGLWNLTPWASVVALSHVKVTVVLPKK